MELPEGFRAEIERKYLLAALPEALSGRASLHIEQGYRSDGLRVRRVREEGGAERYLLTEKRGSGLVRAEREETIERGRFEALWPETLGRRLTKRRFRVPEAGHVFEIDDFLDRTLVLAEVELRDAEERVELPGWLAACVEREVTLDPAYRNSTLAR